MNAVPHRPVTTIIEMVALWSALLSLVAQPILARSTTLAITPSSTPITNPCDPERDLRGRFVSDTRGEITNRSESCSYAVGIAAYRMYDDNIDHQELQDAATATIAPNATLTLDVEIPDCAAQVDLFYGPVLTSLKGQRYGERLLAMRNVNVQDWCVHVTPTATTAPPTSTPTSTPTTATTIPPTATVVPPTAMPTSVPSTPTTAPATVVPPVSSPTREVEQPQQPPTEQPTATMTPVPATPTLPPIATPTALPPTTAPPTMVAPTAAASPAPPRARAVAGVREEAPRAVAPRRALLPATGMDTTEVGLVIALMLLVAGLSIRRVRRTI